MAEDESETLLNLTADIVAAHVSNNSVSVADLPALIARVHEALNGLGAAPVLAKTELKPAVPVRASVKPDHIVCLEDGKKMKMLKRHLATDHGMSPQDYRTKWNLPADYPMVAPNYAAQRKELAVKIGLGRKPKGEPALKPTAQDAAAPKRRAPRARKPAKTRPAES